MTLKKRRIILVLCVLAFLIVAPFVLLYSNGYRLDSHFHLTQTGGLYVASPVSGAQIFVNNTLKRTTNLLQSGLFLQNLKPGNYSVLIAKEGYWPWKKDLDVKEQMVSEARALILPMEPTGRILRQEDLFPSEIEKYETIIDSLQQIKKITNHNATTTIERFTNHEREKVWWNPGENKIWVEWLKDDSSRPYFLSENKVLVLNSIYPVRNVDFFPGRRDVIIVAVQNGIFAIEIDGRGGRTLQPIYKGREPIFTIYKTDPSVYVIDENTLMEIKLE
ncbi:MAG: carboxypeptidase-like regulatory domain-containing protein [Pseudomonadota bacterium]